MNKRFDKFERIVRASSVYHYALRREFQGRNLCSEIQHASERLFCSENFSDATFAAFKIIENKVRRLSNVEEQNFRSVINKAFNPNRPIIRFDTDNGVQEGYKFLFTGAMLGIRNPRAHNQLVETKDQCLEYLSLASLLLRELDSATVVKYP